MDSLYLHGICNEWQRICYDYICFLLVCCDFVVLVVHLLWVLHNLRWLVVDLRHLLRIHGSFSFDLCYLLGVCCDPFCLSRFVVGLFYFVHICYDLLWFFIFGKHLFCLAVIL